MTSRRKTLFWFSVLTSAFLLHAGSMIAARAQDPNTQTPPAKEVRVLLIPVDKDGHFVNTLRADDLRMVVDGTPLAITEFHLLADQTVSVAILIDTSASQERTLPALKLAATSFVDSIIRPDRDEAAIATFTGTLTVEQTFTNNVALLRAAIAHAQFVPPPGYVSGGIVAGPLPPKSSAVPAGSTAIWDSVIAACNDLLSQSHGQTRRALILLTDGLDTVSKNKMSAAVDRAGQDNVVIYSIGIGDTSDFGLDKDALRKISGRTGGRAFFPAKVGELRDAFAEIGQEFRTQYLIVYKATTPVGAAGKIKFELVNPILRKTNVQLYYQQIIPRH